MKRIVLFLVAVVLMSAFCLSVSAEDVLLMENKCEEEMEGVTLMKGSADGTSFYRCESGVDLGYLPYENSSDFIYSLDIRFNNEGCGFSFMKSGKWNSCIRIKDGHLALQTGGNSFQKLCPVDLSAWYHFTFLGRTNREVNTVTYGHIILEEYKNGERVNRQVFQNVNLRNNAATHFINAFGGCDIDNLASYTPAPTKVELSCDSESIVAGESAQFNVVAFYNDLPMHGVNKSDITFSAYIGEAPLKDETIKLDGNGLLTTNPLTASQRVTIKATSKSANLTAEKSIDIVTGDIFTVTGMGVNKEGTTITKLSVKKNFAAYKDNVTFVVAFYNADGSFKGVDFKTMSAKSLAEGDNKVNVNINVPYGFDVYTGKMNVFVVTALSGIGNATKVKAEELPLLDSMAVVMAVKEDCDITNLKGEDVLYFDLVQPESGKITLPSMGKVYVMSSVERLDTLFEIVD